ncbi:hypothetical protein BKA69DRAFT_1098103 [Paraphysoderma sedebokerense]|nr:hypothetical protein BKA69DRAFT_1098103 [Paraphysoderma sedebokerense]
MINLINNAHSATPSSVSSSAAASSLHPHHHTHTLHSHYQHTHSSYLQYPAIHYPHHPSLPHPNAHPHTHSHPHHHQNHLINYPNNNPQNPSQYNSFAQQQQQQQPPSNVSTIPSIPSVPSVPNIPNVALPGMPGIGVGVNAMAGGVPGMSGLGTIPPNVFHTMYPNVHMQSHYPGYIHSPYHFNPNQTPESGLVSVNDNPKSSKRNENVNDLHHHRKEQSRDHVPTSSEKNATTKTVAKSDLKNNSNNMPNGIVKSDELKTNKENRDPSKIENSSEMNGVQKVKNEKSIPDSTIMNTSVTQVKSDKNQLQKEMKLPWSPPAGHLLSTPNRRYSKQWPFGVDLSSPFVLSRPPFTHPLLSVTSPTKESRQPEQKSEPSTSRSRSKSRDASVKVNESGNQTVSKIDTTANLDKKLEVSSTSDEQSTSPSDQKSLNYAAILKSPSASSLSFPPSATSPSSSSSSAPVDASTSTPQLSAAVSSKPSVPESTPTQPPSSSQPSTSSTQASQPSGLKPRWADLVRKPNASSSSASSTSSTPLSASLSAGSQNISQQSNSSMNVGTFAAGPGLQSSKGLFGGVGGRGNKYKVLADIITSFSPSFTGKLIKPRGLINNGNTCYRNSILHPILRAKPFYDLLHVIAINTVHEFKSQTPLLDAFIAFMKEFEDDDSADSPSIVNGPTPGSVTKTVEEVFDSEPFVPEDIYNALNQLTAFASMKGRQEDAQEFLGLLLDALTDEFLKVLKIASTTSLSSSSTQLDASLSKPIESTQPAQSNPGAGTGNSAGDWIEVGPKNKVSVTRSIEIEESPISKIFGGKLRSVVKRSGCKDSVTVEPFQSLPLDITPDNVLTIEDAINHLTMPETLEGYTSQSKGHQVDATKQTFIEECPPVLILHSKRFIYTPSNGVQKLRKHIDCDLTLSIRDQWLSPGKRGMGKLEYRLFAVVYHHGNLAAGGHYTCSVLRQNNKQWVHIDDTKISTIPPSEVCGEHKDRLPYLYFFEIIQQPSSTLSPSPSFVSTSSSSFYQSTLSINQGGYNVLQSSLSNSLNSSSNSFVTSTSNPAASNSSLNSGTSSIESSRNNSTSHLPQSKKDKDSWSIVERQGYSNNPNHSTHSISSTTSTRSNRSSHQNVQSNSTSSKLHTSTPLLNSSSVSSLSTSSSSLPSHGSQQSSKRKKNRSKSRDHNEKLLGSGSGLTVGSGGNVKEAPVGANWTSVPLKKR